MVDPSMFVKYAWPIFLITLVVISGKVFFSCFGFIISGQGLKTSVQGGFSLAQVGEFAFIIASLGLGLGVIDAKVYPIIVAVSVITTFLTPMMIRSSAPVYRMLEKVFPIPGTAMWNKAVKPRRRAKLRSSAGSCCLRVIFALKPFCHDFVYGSGVVGLFSAAMGHAPVARFTRKADYDSRNPFADGSFFEGVNRLGNDSAQFRQRKDSVFLLPDCSGQKSGRRQKSVIKKLEEKISFCSVMEEVENEKDFFISNNRIAALYYKLWKARRINRLPLIVLTSFRLILVAFLL